MAIGDVVTNVQSVAAVSSVNYQPAAGVEVIIGSFGESAGAADITLNIYDGTNAAVVAVGSSSYFANFAARPCITNTVYARVTNTHATLARIEAITGIQSK